MLTLQKSKKHILKREILPKNVKIIPENVKTCSRGLDRDSGFSLFCNRIPEHGLQRRQTSHSTGWINQYERDMMTENDYRNTIAFARKKAIAEGHAEGLAEGMAEGKAAERVLIAKALKGQGVAIGTIAAATGLSAQEIAGL